MDNLALALPLHIHLAAHQTYLQCQPDLTANENYSAFPQEFDADSERRYILKSDPPAYLQARQCAENVRLPPQ